LFHDISTGFLAITTGKLFKDRIINSRGFFTHPVSIMIVSAKSVPQIRHQGPVGDNVSVGISIGGSVAVGAGGSVGILVISSVGVSLGGPISGVSVDAGVIVIAAGKVGEGVCGAQGGTIRFCPTCRNVEYPMQLACWSSVTLIPYDWLKR
jgi:hypothetical protein